MKIKLINEKGKLFGIINIIDLIVLLAIALLALVGVKFMRSGGFAALSKEDSEGFMGPETTLEIEFYGEEVSDFVVNQLYEGAYLYDETSLEDLGVLTSYVIGDSIAYSPNDQGISVAAPKPDYKSVKITGVVEGERTPLGATVGTAHYASGHTFVLRAGDAKIYLRVYDVRAKQRRLRRPLNIDFEI